MRVKCGTKYEADPEEVQIAIDYSSSKEFPGHTKFGTNKFTKGTSAATFKQVSSQLKYPDGSYECFAALMPGEGTKSKYEVIGLQTGSAWCASMTCLKTCSACVEQTKKTEDTVFFYKMSTLFIRYYSGSRENQRFQKSMRHMGRCRRRKQEQIHVFIYLKSQNDL